MRPSRIVARSSSATAASVRASKYIQVLYYIQRTTQGDAVNYSTRIGRIMTDTQYNPILDGKPAHPLLVVLSGPSGVGKDSILMRMREIGFPFHFVVTATSRPMRPGERPGYDYHFVGEERFRQMIDQEELLEWAEVYGHYKGIPKSEVREALASGRDVILRIDVQGAATI